jgi:flagellar operon protein
VVDQILPGQLIQPGQAITPRTPGATLPGASTAQGQAFRQLLDESLRTVGGVKFSAHAMKRLESRGISLGAQEVSAIEDAVGRAAAKGARDSLVLSEHYAMVVNIPSRTVVTAFDKQGLNENVVTNIDSAVFV